MHTNRLVTLADPHSAAAEAYHALRFNLAYTSLDKPLEVLVVSSAAPQTGKSYVAANLGVVMAQAGQRVVLVDADLRRPQLHTLLEQPRDPGLTTAILDEEALSEPELRETSVPGLRLLT
ncbi:MAG TPA: tyrosine-protein kinase family protein, partial [Chloroflexi bacterium]|nr:tyrosine-protein kinase family protein [Chloroflexota bacterium]